LFINFLIELSLSTTVQSWSSVRWLQLESAPWHEFFVLFVAVSVTMLSSDNDSDDVSPPRVTTLTNYSQILTDHLRHVLQCLRSSPALVRWSNLRREP
jgi:hypothetical protein